jgi:hypothetical protein
VLDERSCACPVSKQASANAARAALHRLSTVAAIMAAAETAIAANGRGLWDRWRARANVDQSLVNYS